MQLNRVDESYNSCWYKQGKLNLSGTGDIFHKQYCAAKYGDNIKLMTQRKQQHEARI